MDFPNNPPTASTLRKLLLDNVNKVTFLHPRISFSELTSLTIPNSDFLQQIGLLTTSFPSLQKLSTDLYLQKQTVRELVSIPSLIDLQIVSSLKDFAQVSIGKKNLKRLMSNNTQLDTESWLEVIRGMPQLESIGNLRELNEELISSLKSLKNLKEIQLTLISSPMIVTLVQTIPTLTSLNLHHCGLYDQSLQKILPHIPNIIQLDLQRNRITLKGTKQLAQLKHLQKLKIPYNYNMYEQGEGLSFAKNLRGLRGLVILSIQLSRKSFEEMSREMKFLEKLKVDGYCGWQTDFVNECIQRMVTLKKLSLYYSTDNRFGEMIADNLPDLKSLKLCGKEVDRGVGDAGCFYLSRLRELERVELVKNELMSVGVGKLLRNVRCAEFNFGSG